VQKYTYFKTTKYDWRLFRLILNIWMIIKDFGYRIEENQTAIQVRTVRA